MPLFEGLKRRFASTQSKLTRICIVTGNVDKLQILIEKQPNINLEKIRKVRLRVGLELAKTQSRLIRICIVTGTVDKL
jgi:hypothetical protein